MGATVSITLVITLIFLTLTIIWMAKSREFLLTLFAMTTMAFFAIAKPEIPTAIRDFITMVVKTVIGIFS